MEGMTELRMDKWLWAARFFKTRALAARACELGRVTANGQPAKSARPVRVGDLLQVKTEGGDFQVEVLLLSEVRGPAAVARRRFTGKQRPAGALRQQMAEERKAMPRFEILSAGKPSKRNRRVLDRLRGRGRPSTMHHCSSASGCYRSPFLSSVRIIR